MSAQLRGSGATPRVLGLASSEPEFRDPSTGVGGVVHYLFRALAEQAEVVDVFHPEPPWTVRWWGRAAVLKHDSRIRHLAYPLHERFFVAKSRRCRAEIERRRDRVDVVLQSLMHFAPTDAYPSRVPYCLYLDWTTPLTEREYPEWTMVRVGDRFERLQRRLLANAAYVFTFTELVRKSIVHDYGVSPDRVIKVGAGINLDAMPSPRPDDELHGDPVLLTIASAFELKGVDVLLRALPLIRHRFPGCRALVVGEASLRTPALPGVELVRRATKSHLERLYRAATLFVLPTRAEAFGIAYAEAMAFQLPCLATRTGGVPEVVDDGRTGYLVPVGDHVALAERAIELLSNPARLAEMGRNAQATAAGEFTWRRVVDRMLPHLVRAARAGAADRG